MKMRFIAAVFLTICGATYGSNSTTPPLVVSSLDNSKPAEVKNTTVTRNHTPADVLNKRGSVSLHRDGKVDYVTSLADGFPISPNIEEIVGGQDMINTLSDVHQSIFINSNLEQRCLISSRALMDKYERHSLMNGVIGRGIPTFWNLVKKASHAGKYLVTSTAPILSATSLLMSKLQGSSSEDGSEEQGTDVIKTIDAVSLLAFQIGTYVLSNIYDYSKLLSEYYLHESFEKQYIKATTNLSDEPEYAIHLPLRQRSGNFEGIQIDDLYFQKCGPLITETAREILKHQDQNEAIATMNAAKKATSIQDAYNSSNTYSILSGVCRIVSGLFALGTTAITTSSLITNGEPLDQTLYAIQIASAPLSMLFGGLTTYFAKKSGEYSKRCLLYPIHNPSLLGEMITSQENDELEEVKVVKDDE